MIDYRIFQVACPPLTGAKWLVQAAQLCGLGPGFTEHIYGLFPKEHSGLLRVSLVRHPCDWLTACYAHFQQGDTIQKFSGKPHHRVLFSGAHGHEALRYAVRP